MKRIGFLLVVLLSSPYVQACPFCNTEIRNKIYDDRFLPNLFVLLLAFLVLGVIVAVLSTLSTKKHHAHLSRNNGKVVLNPVPLTTTSIVLGIGIGGFIDGIVLHQVLQWHEMLSARIPPTNYVGKSVNMFWDGIFHAFTLVVTFVGIVLLWRLLKRKDIDHSGKLLTGGLIGGWGIFNLVEGVIDHQILKLHNVRELSANPEAWNIGFLGISVVLLVLGGVLIGRRRRELYMQIV
jgi:uncharacterized membrane protein